MTYGELNASANRLAHRLRGLGVGRGQAVAVCLDRSPCAVVGLLGILKAGAAFVPLNFEHPPSRLAHQIQEAEAVALVTQEQLLERLPAFSGQVVCLDRDEAELAAQPDSDPEPVNELEDLAYIMYTSGSTGLPKGVAVTHGNVANYTARHARPLRRGRRSAALRGGLRPQHRPRVHEHLPAARRAGARIHLAQPGRGDRSGRVRRLRARDARSTSSRSRRRSSARCSRPGAGTCCRGDGSSAAARRSRSSSSTGFARTGPDCRILNHYGPTETTIGTCVLRGARRTLAWPSASVPIGRPLENTQAYIVDAVGGADAARASPVSCGSAAPASRAAT